MTEEAQRPSSSQSNSILPYFYGALIAAVVVAIVFLLKGILGQWAADQSQSEVETAPPVSKPEPESAAIASAPPPQPNPVPRPSDERAMELANRLGADAMSLVGIVSQLAERLENSERELAGANSLYSKSVRQIGKLEDDLAAATLKAQEVERLREQIVEANTLLALADRRANALMKQLAASPDPATLSAAQAMRQKFERELSETKDRLARDQIEKEKLRAELAAANSELAASETALEATSLFISRIELLPDAAKQLFLELSRLETVERPELEKNYRLIQENLGARVVDTVQFPTGSSEVSAAKSASVRRAMASGSDDSFFLVIGYASKTGNFEINKSLSSERATAVATLAEEAAKPGQRVRAVFLGQTDRFSGTNVLEDQICELWEIPKR